MPAARASLASLAKRCGAGDLADELGRGQRPEAGLGEQLGRELGDEIGDLAFERFDRVGQLAQAPQLVAGDAHAHRLLGAGQAPRDPRAPLRREQRAAGEHELGPEVVQVPLQRVIEPDALADQALAVIDQQPHVELGPVELRDAAASPRPSRRAARATASASMRSDLPRSRAPRRASAMSLVGTRTTRSPRPIKKRSKEPATCRQSSSAHTRSPPRRRAQRNSSAKPRAPTPTVFSPCSSPVPAATAAIVCERLWVSAPSTIIDVVLLFVLFEVDTRRTRLAGGAATLLSSHAGHPRPATSDTTKGSQAHRPTASKRVSSPPVGTFSSASDVTDQPNPNSKPRSSSRCECRRDAASRSKGKGPTDASGADPQHSVCPTTASDTTPPSGKLTCDQCAG